MAQQDLVPLFLFKEADSNEMKQAGVIVTANGETYKASSLVGNIAKAIQSDIEALVQAKEMGELTIAAYTLLESLHRVGMVKTADQLLSEPSSLFHSTLCTAIGMRAGMMIPEGARFETTTSDSSLSIRNITEEENSISE